MGRLFDSLTKYFETTSPEVLEQDWNELMHLNQLGPDALLLYAEEVRVPYPSSLTSTQLEFSPSKETRLEITFTSDTPTYFAA